MHDSNGAKDFVLQCVDEIREKLPKARIETRVDSAFFSQTIVDALHGARVQFTASVPFEAFCRAEKHAPGAPTLAAHRRGAELLRRASGSPTAGASATASCSSESACGVRTRCRFSSTSSVPHEEGYDFKVIVANKRVRAKRVVRFHEGRGSQEEIFAELKSHCQMDYVAVTTRVGNQLYLVSGMLVHNLTRELQMNRPPTATLEPPPSVRRFGPSRNSKRSGVISFNAPAGYFALEGNLCCP